MSLRKSSINPQQNFTAPNSTNACIYEFEDFRLDATHLMLYKNGSTVALKPKVVETLVALVERPGEVISKDELMDRVWHDSFVGETNLSQNIYLLRKTLGTCAGGQPLIETFWRRGYRFNGKVREAGDVEVFFSTHTKTLVVSEESFEDEPEGKAGAGRTTVPKHVSIAPWPNSSWTKPAFAAVVLISGSLLIFSAQRFLQEVLVSGTFSGTNSAVSSPVIKMTRLTPDLSVDQFAISPDGRYLAYDLIEKGRHCLWIKDIASGSTRQVMPPSDVSYGALSFSPDGTQIYYTKFLKGSPNGTIFRIPTFGGEPQAIARNIISPQTLSPDGAQMAFVRGNELVIAQTDGSGEHVLQTRFGTTAAYESWDSNLSWSPDGMRIAICGSRTEGTSRRRYELIEVLVTDGTERNIPIPDWNYVDDVRWLYDQTGLIVRARETEGSPWQIWRVSYPNGEINRITNDLNNYDNLSLSADSRLLVVRKQLTNMNLWTLPIGEATAQAKQITFGNDANDGFYGIAFTPDGRIIYTSPRDGNIDLWIMNADGSDQRQLTKNAGGLNTRPLVTPNGRTIIFISSRSGLRQLWRMDADGGNPSQLIDLPEDFEVERPVLSPDGQWVYFCQFGKGRSSIVKVPVGGGEPVTVRDAGWPFSISPNGKLMLFGYYDQTSSQPWKHGVLSLENGQMMKVLDSGFRVFGWTADSRSLISAGSDKGSSDLWLQPIDKGELKKLTNFKSGVIYNFALAPDSKQIALSRGNASAEAILITDF